MVAGKEGIANLVSNVFIILIAVTAIVIIGVVISSITSNVEDPVIVSKCRAANPVDDASFIDCVKQKTGSEQKAIELILDSPYQLSPEYYDPKNDGGKNTTNQTKVNGVCGTNNFTCVSGILSNMSLSDPLYYTWNCLGSNGGNSSFCRYPKSLSNSSNQTINQTEGICTGSTQLNCSALNEQDCSIMENYQACSWDQNLSKCFDSKELPSCKDYPSQKECTIAKCTWINDSQKEGLGIPTNFRTLFTKSSLGQINLAWKDNSQNESNFVIDIISANGMPLNANNPMYPLIKEYISQAISADKTNGIFSVPTPAQIGVNSYSLELAIKSCSGSGQSRKCSDYSNKVIAYLFSTPDMPSNFRLISANSKNGEVKLAWNDNSDDENQFLIEFILTKNDPGYDALSGLNPTIIEANTTNTTLVFPISSNVKLTGYTAKLFIVACNGRQDTTFECSNQSNMVEVYIGP